MEEFKVKNIIRDSLEDYPINAYQQKEVEDLFFKLMKEEKNKNKDNDLQESLVTAIMHDVATQDTTEKIFGRYGDNAHLSFFDDFLEDGVTSKITEILQKHGISTSVLRGVTKGQPFDISTQTDVGEITVKGKISPSPTGEEDDDYLAIYKDGVLIYKWKREREYEEEEYVYTEEDEEQSKYEERKEKKVQEYIKMQETKSGKRRRNPVFKIDTTPEDTYTFEYAKIRNNLVVIKRDSKGRFAKQ